MEQGEEDGEREKKKLERESGGELVMDTPEKGRLATHLSKFEDSPVFNYICNLSPLETTRPPHMSQSFNSYSFSSVPSIFTSPHVSSIKETNVLRRSRSCSDGRVIDVAHKAEVCKENFDPGGCIDKSFNKGKLEDEVSQSQNYDSHASKDSMVICHGVELKCVPAELGGSSSSLVCFGQEGPASDFVNNRERNSEDGSFDWVNISDAAEFLVFDSPDNAVPFKGSFLKPLDSETSLPISEKTADVLVGVEINETEITLLPTGEDQLNVIEANGAVHAFTCLNNQVSEGSNEVIENESACDLPRGVRRRCLVFDTGVARQKSLADGSSSSSSSSTLSKCHVTSNENQSIPSKPDHSSSRCIVPGIGLHLNAIARTLNGYTVSNHETFATPRQSRNDFRANAASDSFANNQETTNQSLVLSSVHRDVGHYSGFGGIEEAYQPSGYLGSHDLNRGSSTEKRRKLEDGGEAESCKRCNCKKSKCLKLYCECFAAGVYCVEPCSCQDCFNKPIHEDTVLATRKAIESRNPLAFAPRVIRTTETTPETLDDLSSTPASARHKRGCNCKKSGCLKKYCECFQGGVGCSINCRCEGCKNAFGRKDGSYIIHPEAEETETHGVSVLNQSLSKHITQYNTDQTPRSFVSKNKSLLSTCSSSSSLYGGQKTGIPAFLQPQTNLKKRVLDNSESNIPEILRSPTSGIQSSSSPNSKRVSPPHCDFVSSSSPAPRSTRKRILHSIPSFPSLKD